MEARAKNDPTDLLATGNFSDALDDSDEKTLVAMNILQTLETLLRSISTAPPIVAQLETILMPALSLTIQHEFIGEIIWKAGQVKALTFIPALVELYDDLLELAHSLTYYQRSISPQMWQFFEQLFQLFKGSGVDFVEGEYGKFGRVWTNVTPDHTLYQNSTTSSITTSASVGSS